MSTTAADLPPKAAEFARILQEHMPELEREYGVASLALFGSYVRGEEREDSDLDVLVDLSRPMGMLAFIALGDYLSQLVGKRVDLTTTRSASERRSGKRLIQESVPI
ncbi:MAG: nucleotidyltransferase family protein [Chloroflexota bacterium]|nr:nucleotidyltransferase family protein [Chloroflexota bacterium]